MKRQLWNNFCDAHHIPRSSNGGQAALITVIFFLGIALTFTFSFTSSTFQELSTSRKQVNAKQSYFLAEAGTEDIVYRIKQGKNYPESETFMLNGSTASVTVTTDGATKTVRSSGDVFSSVRNVETMLERTTDGSSFFYGAQVGYLGLRMQAGARVNGSIFSNGSVTGTGAVNKPVVDGDIFTAIGIGINPDQENGPSDDETPFEYPVHNENGKRNGAQSFIPTLTAEPLRVDFFVKRVGNPGNATIKIVPDDGGTPRHNQAVASGPLRWDKVDPDTFEWVTMTFNVTDAVTSGAPYWILIDTGGYNNENYYIFGGNTDVSYANGTFLYTDNWTNPSAVWNPPDTGPADIAFKIYLAEINTFVDHVQAGDPITGGVGTVHTYELIDTDVAGDAYVNVKDASSVVYGSTFAFDDILPIDPPLTDVRIQDWKDEGFDGGLGLCDYTNGCPRAAGTFTLKTNGEFWMKTGDSAVTSGPMYIPGRLRLENDATLTLGGALYVQGNMLAQNQCVVQLDPSYGIISDAIVVDGTVIIEGSGGGGCTFRGSGDPASYLIVATTAPDISSPPALRIKGNNTDVDIVYASRGRLHIQESPAIKTAFGEEVYIDDSAVLTYEEGLASISFSEGPGGGYDIAAWREVE